MIIRVFSIKCNRPKILSSLKFSMVPYIFWFVLFTLFLPFNLAQNTKTGYLFGLPDKSCTGIPLTSSKFCSGFASAFLAPTNIVPGLLYLLNHKEDNMDAAEPLIRAKYDQLVSVEDFDDAFRKVILPNVHTIASRQTTCPYKNYGLLGLITYSCQWLVNYGVLYPAPQNWFQTSCSLLNSQQGRIPGLCISTTNDFVASAQKNFDRDPSCTSLSKDNMLSVTNQYLLSSRNVSNRNDVSSSCISWQTNEASLNLCGYHDTIQACLNDCKASNLDCPKILNGYVMQTNSSKGVSTVQITVAVVSLLLALGCGSYLVYHQKKKGTPPMVASFISKTKQIFEKPGSSSTSSSRWKSSGITPKKTTDTKTHENPFHPRRTSQLYDNDNIHMKGTGIDHVEKGEGTAPKLTLPSLNIPDNPFYTSPGSSLMGPASLNSSNSNSMYSTTSSQPGVHSYGTLKQPLKSALSQPPLTMKDEQKARKLAEVDKDNDLPLGFTLKNAKPFASPPIKPPHPTTSLGLNRSSLSSLPLPRYIPSAIGSATIAPVAPSSSSSSSDSNPSSVLSLPMSNMISTVSETRAQSLISVNTTDSVMFRRETLLRAGSMMSEAIRVKYEFKPDRTDEIELNPGDKVVVITRYEDGWGWGCKYDSVTGKENIGAFPLNCLEDFYPEK